MDRYSAVRGQFPKARWMPAPPVLPPDPPPPPPAPRTWQVGLQVPLCSSGTKLHAISVQVAPQIQASTILKSEVTPSPPPTPCLGPLFPLCHMHPPHKSRHGYRSHTEVAKRPTGRGTKLLSCEVCIHATDAAAGQGGVEIRGVKGG